MAALPSYCTVTEIVVECWTAPDVPFTITEKFCGDSSWTLLLLPPHAAGRIVATITKRHSAHIPRRFLSKLVVNTHPSRQSGSHVANKLRTASNLGGGLNPADNARASIVSVTLFPGVTALGEIPHVGMGAGPVTEQASAMLPENPPCAGNVSNSLA
jgi:hypothetical protein